VASDPTQYTQIKVDWDRFPDQTDNIVVHGWNPTNMLKHQHILFLANFDSNGTTLSQFYVMYMLLESFIKDMTIVLPFFPSGTMERVMKEGEVATANTLCKMLSNMPDPGRPTRVMVYDLHTLQNRFYMSNNALMTLHTGFPLIIDQIKDPANKIDAVAFPDDGAAKRFGKIFKNAFPDMELITMGKHRDPVDRNKRTIVIQDGNCKGKNVLMIDDLVQTGGTLTAAAKALKSYGANEVSAYCTHAVFPNEAWKRYIKGGDRAEFKKFYVTNSIPKVTNRLPKDDCFEVLDILPLISHDLIQM